MSDQQGAMNGKPTRLQSSEAWVALVLRVLFAVAGVTILVAQALGAADNALHITIGGIGLCGPVVGATAGSFVDAIKGSGK